MQLPTNAAIAYFPLSVVCGGLVPLAPGKLRPWL